MADQNEQALDSGRRPNVVYIVIDDMGFAATGAFGNDVIQTPNIDRLADEGLRYNNFHTTAICSATRASLLTGANHHKVGVNSVIDFTSGASNSKGHIDHAYGTTAEILKTQGYATFAVGKWHLTTEQTAAGPYDDWPLGRGFDRYYGVLPGMGDQFHPVLVQDNSMIDQPKTVAEGYHLSEDIIDHAIDYVFTEQTAYPDTPFFLYAAFGATHSPFHAPKEYIDAYRGKFDEGWDVLRQRWFENQKRKGVIPADAELTERNELVPAWDELSADERLLAERYMEAYAGFLTHTDEQIGRLIEYLRYAGILDNTIVVLLSDNGASGEGGRNGKFDSLRMDHGIARRGKDVADIEYALAHLDEIGGEYSYVHYPQGWANALNAPFPWYKVWTFEGGVKDDLIIRYPGAIKDPGSVRGQYAHVSDVTPTVLDEIGIDKPASIRGVAQQPFTGTSFAYTFADSDAADRKHVQYYEMLGNRAIYQDGWKAVVNHSGRGWDYSKDEWELYHVAVDYSEVHDVAAEYPEKLRELEDLFLVEAGKNGVFPLVPGPIAPHSTDIETGDGKRSAPRVAVYRKIVKPYRLADQRAIAFADRKAVDLDSGSHKLLAQIVRENDDDGVIFSRGDRFGGFVLFILDGVLRFTYNDNRLAYTDVIAPDRLPSGAVEVGYELIEDGAGAQVTLLVGGNAVASAHVDERYDVTGWPTEIKANHYTEVSPAYQVPFEFTGRIDEVRLEQLDGRAVGGPEASDRATRSALHTD